MSMVFIILAFMGAILTTLHHPVIGAVGLALLTVAWRILAVYTGQSFIAPREIEDDSVFDASALLLESVCIAFFFIGIRLPHMFAVLAIQEKLKVTSSLTARVILDLVPEVIATYVCVFASAMIHEAPGKFFNKDISLSPARHHGSDNFKHGYLRVEQ